jgi:tripartite-type tricarboxylate transporter receptor subunit TctC
MRKKDRWVRSFHILNAAVLGLTAAGSKDAAAQAYPSRPITMIVPFPAGGPSDTLARVLSEHVRGSLGQPIVIENVAGASGSIGVGRVARASPDGYTLTLGNWPTHVINGAVYALPYDLRTDFEPVSLIANNPQLIVTKKAMPAQNLNEFIGWLKANPDKASKGTSGVGSAIHVAGVFLQQETGTRFQFVPYRGGVPAMQDLVAGQIDFMIDLAANALPHVRAGSIKAYAVTDKKRLPSAPEIPTVDEAGVPGLHVSTWFGLWGTKGTPRAVVTKLNASLTEALADPAVRMRFADLGQEMFPREQQTPEALAAFHKAEIEKWWPIIKAAGIKAE